MSGWTSPCVGGHSHLTRTQGLRKWLGKHPKVQAWMSDLKTMNWGSFANQENGSMCIFHWLASNLVRHRGGRILGCLCSGVHAPCSCLCGCWKGPSCLCVDTWPVTSVVLIFGTLTCPQAVSGPGNDDSSKQTERRNLMGLWVLVQPGLSKVSSISFVWRLSAKYVTLLHEKGQQLFSKGNWPSTPSSPGEQVSKNNQLI